MTKDEALALSEKQHTFPDKKQPAQEPVAWYWDNNHRDKIPYVGVERGNPKMDDIFGTPIPLYPHPAPSWQGLSIDEILIICAKMAAKLPNKEIDLIFARAIEQALKEKNNAVQSKL